MSHRPPRKERIEPPGQPLATAKIHETRPHRNQNPVKARRIGLGVAVALALTLAAALLTLTLRPHRTTGSAPRPAPGSASASGSAPAPGGCRDGRHPCGFPDAATTGVPAGVVLRSVPGQISSGPGWHFDPRGWVQVDGNGAVLSGLYIPYSVSVAASHVTIKDVRIVVSLDSRRVV